MLATFSFMKPVFSFLQNANLKTYVHVAFHCLFWKQDSSLQRNEYFGWKRLKKEEWLAEVEYGTLTSLWGPRFCSRRRGPRAAHEDLSAGQGGGALGTSRRRAVLQRPSIPVRSALRGESWHCLHGPGMNGVRAWRAWGSREELNRRTQLACLGFFGAPVAGINPYFFHVLCYPRGSF